MNKSPKYPQHSLALCVFGAWTTVCDLVQSSTLSFKTFLPVLQNKTNKNHNSSLPPLSRLSFPKPKLKEIVVWPPAQSDSTVRPWVQNNPINVQPWAQKKYKRCNAGINSPSTSNMASFLYLGNNGKQNNGEYNGK